MPIMWRASAVLNAAPALSGKVAGIELVGGIGVHAGLKFREPLPVPIWISRP